MVPSDAFLVGTQTGPVAHDIVPVRQGFELGVHALSGAHAMHTPALHT